MDDAINNFYLQKPEPVKSCLLALRTIILAYNANMAESLNYGMPLFSSQGKRLCYLWTDKKTGDPYVLMVDGNKINHPALVQGSRKRMKVLPINQNEDIDVETIYKVFDIAKAP